MWSQDGEKRCMTHRKLVLSSTWVGAGEVSKPGWGWQDPEGVSFVCGLEWVGSVSVFLWGWGSVPESADGCVLEDSASLSPQTSLPQSLGSRGETHTQGPHLPSQG